MSKLYSTAGLLLCCLILNGCQQSEINKLRAENEALKAEAAELRKRLAGGSLGTSTQSRAPGVAVVSGVGGGSYAIDGCEALYQNRDKHLNKRIRFTGAIDRFATDKFGFENCPGYELNTDGLSEAGRRILDQKVSYSKSEQATIVGRWVLKGGNYVLNAESAYWSKKIKAAAAPVEEASPEETETAVP